MQKISNPFIQNNNLKEEEFISKSYLVFLIEFFFKFKLFCLKAKCWLRMSGEIF